MGLIIGFTGTREALTNRQMRSIVKFLRTLQLPDAWVVHGDCVGADDFFGKTAYNLGYFVQIRPGCDAVGESPYRASSPSHLEYPLEPYLDRNKKIVHDATLMLAAPKEETEQKRSGTWSTIRYAKLVDKPCFVLKP